MRCTAGLQLAAGTRGRYNIASGSHFRRWLGSCAACSCIPIRSTSSAHFHVRSNASGTPTTDIGRRSTSSATAHHRRLIWWAWHRNHLTRLGTRASATCHSKRYRFEAFALRPMRPCTLARGCHGSIPARLQTVHMPTAPHSHFGRRSR